jgi:hypothetical protein
LNAEPLDSGRGVLEIVMRRLSGEVVAALVDAAMELSHQLLAPNRVTILGRR